MHLIIPTIPSALQHVKAGRLRALAVTGARRSQAAPELPTMIEAGLPGYTHSNWYGLAVPAGTAKVVVAKLNATIVAAAGNVQFRQQIADLGMEVETNAPEEFESMVRAEIQKWQKVIRFAGIKSE